MRGVMCWLLLGSLVACTSTGSVTRNIDGNRVAYISAGRGALVVVFESGMGATMSTWNPILSEVARFASVFAYDRPGYGVSSTHHTPKSASEIARRLRRTLSETGQSPPFVLVGHSAGGLYVNAFARIYPAEVAGLVLIDSSHPAQFEYQKKEMPVAYAILNVAGSLGPRRYELAVLKQVGREFELLGPFPNIPVTVLTAEKSFLLETKTMREQWLKFQTDLADLSPSSTHAVVADSSHFIHRSNPESVIRAIRQMVER